MRGTIDERYEYQQDIIRYLTEHDGYIERKDAYFDILHAMDPELLMSFLNKTQPDEMAALKKMYKDDLQETIVNSINSFAVSKNGSILYLLKHGIEIANHKLTLLYEKPATNFNPELTKKYESNILSVMQEVHYIHKENDADQNKQRVDLVLFVNGIAIISIELKSNGQGQNYEDAIEQYRKDRDPKARLFLFKAGCLVNFAMDCEEVYMTTKLDKEATFFMPFNKGKGEGVFSGAGNPILKDDYDVSYMWKDIFTKDTLIELITKFIFIEKKESKDEVTGKKKVSERVIFPRYHQLDALRKIIADLKINHTDQNYLIEHSAGSGKTNTIAWLAHRLASLHDNDDHQIFDNIIIMTDRVVVDRQLQKAIMGLEHRSGLIQVMNDKCTSADLKYALESNTKIIVTTIQKFPYVVDLIKDSNDKNVDLKNKKFAVIIDEAHSSTAGKDMIAVTQTLSTEKEDDDIDLQDALVKEIQGSGKQNNVSMFAFTATPKSTTLHLFGRQDKNGNWAPFHLYSMKQAIEEGYILDVLANYTTYKTYYKINKEIQNDPELQTSDAKRQIAKIVDLDDTNIDQKVNIILDHFINHVMPELGGNAKAMVITASREAAVKYKFAFEKVIKKNNYTDIKTLVAFSGKVKLNDDEYTEASINGFSEDKTAKEFNKPEYKLLLVANKYQTGFDQPKLCAMYILKPLHGVNTVQTLSRLNRICPPYEKIPFVLDFVNDYKSVEKDFEPYYTTTLLSNSVTPQSVANLAMKIDGYYILVPRDVDDANQILHQKKITSRDKQTLSFFFNRVTEEISKRDKEEQKEIYQALKSFKRCYEFLLQVSDLEDIELQKKYDFIIYLLKYMNINKPGEGYDLTNKVKAYNFNQKKTGEFKDNKHNSSPVVKLPVADSVNLSEEKKKKLSEIIREINEKTGSDFDEDVAVKSMLQIKDLMMKSNHLKSSAANNKEKDFELTYFDNIDNILVDGLDQNQKFFTFLLKNKEFKKEILGTFAEEIYKALRKGNKPEE